MKPIKLKSSGAQLHHIFYHRYILPIDGDTVAPVSSVKNICSWTLIFRRGHVNRAVLLRRVALRRLRQFRRPVSSLAKIQTPLVVQNWCSWPWLDDGNSVRKSVCQSVSMAVGSEMQSRSWFIICDAPITSLVFCSQSVSDMYPRVGQTHRFDTQYSMSAIASLLCSMSHRSSESRSVLPNFLNCLLL